MNNFFNNKYKLLDENLLLDDVQYNEKEDIQRTNKIIISLSTIPTRFISDKFDDVILSLTEQLLPADCIIINVCKIYKKLFVYDPKAYKNKLSVFCNKFKNVYINVCDTDYGPSTKILGLISFDQKFNEDDFVIVVDDDHIMNNKMTFYHNYVFKVYQPDCVGVNKNTVSQIFYNNYFGEFCGKLSWSIRYKYINGILDSYNKYSRLDVNLWKTDDLIITRHYKTANLYACCINLFFPKIPVPKCINNNGKLFCGNLYYEKQFSFYNNFHLFLNKLGEHNPAIKKYINQINITIINSSSFIITIKNNSKELSGEIQNAFCISLSHNAVPENIICSYIFKTANIFDKSYNNTISEISIEKTTTQQYKNASLITTKQPKIIKQLITKQPKIINQPPIINKPEKTNQSETTNQAETANQSDILNIYVINIKTRTDRKKNIIEQFRNMRNINLIFFEAYQETDGRIGCAKSHMALINFARKNKLKYIIVMEDDFIFNPLIGEDEFYKIIKTLSSNTDNYQMFNGSPTFWDKRNNLSSIHKFNSLIKDFYFIEFGQKTTFMIYTEQMYQQVLQYYDPFVSQLHIDQYFSYNFVQLCYKIYICYEQPSFSNIANSMIDNNKYIKAEESFYINLALT